uniref:YhcH/YjgK/YiaL family protein n=1 Tax=Fusobacterium sp. TaxID=68766 RepID=UPI0025BB19B5
ALDSIVNKDYENKAIGRNEIEKDDVFFNVQEIITKDIEGSFFETHKKYIDIQIVIEGSENYGILLSDKDLEIVEPFNFEKDFTLFNKKPETIITLTPEDFIIFFTDEPHMPGLKVLEKKAIKKVVYKIKNN